MEINLSLDEKKIKNYPHFEILKQTVFNIFEGSGIPKEKIAKSL
jgi:hypothetical protein